MHPFVRNVLLLVSVVTETPVPASHEFIQWENLSAWRNSAFRELFGDKEGFQVDSAVSAAAPKLISELALEPKPCSCSRFQVYN